VYRYDGSMRRTRGPARIGVISDTHGLLRPEAVRALRGSSLIVHAGDIGTPDVLSALREIAPVVAVRGNNDRGAWARTLEAHRTLDVAGVRLHVTHDLGELVIDPAADGVDVVVAGHSHRPSSERRGGVLFLNPGSAGPRRFSLPITVARLSISAGRLRARIVPLLVAVPPPTSPG
jgi:putative phosphoesterase